MGDRDKLLMQAIPGLPDVRPGDDVGALLLDALARAGLALEERDIVVIAHKIVSKAEGRIVRYADVVPSEKAIELGRSIRKDPRKVELILRESRSILRAADRPGLPEGILIAEHRLGFVSANAAIDESNVGEADTALLLPEDPDASARAIRKTLEAAAGRTIGVVISDTFGRPWRLGQVNVAVGLAGVPASLALAGRPDAYGRILHVTQPATADELAAAAGLLMPKDGKRPAVVCRGLSWQPCESAARDLIRPKEEDLFL
ncbi:MAG: coenzyme F420-0:L-glutamate ligase [Alphaproteobacteria bacterium]